MIVASANNGLRVLMFKLPARRCAYGRTTQGTCAGFDTPFQRAVTDRGLRDECAGGLHYRAKEALIATLDGLRQTILV
jgi:hypothetical protein